MTATRLFAFCSFALLGGCGSDSSGGDTDGGTDTDISTTTAPTGNPSTATPTSAPGSSSTTTDETAANSGGSDDTDPTDPTDPTESDSEDTGIEPGTPQIPELQGECPELAESTGENASTLSFPVGAGSREALVWYDPAQGGGGPLVFYFHGSGGDPEDALDTLTNDVIDDVVALGGMVIAPISDPAASIEWFLVSGGAQNDMVMMDSMVACAAQDADIDPYRIHSMGFSAGGLHVAMSSILRSSYIASTVTYSGGIYDAQASQDSASTPSALIFHGGPEDNVGGVPFNVVSQDYSDVITERGGHAVICDHNTGHGYPDNEAGVWRRLDAYNFFVDHPFGVDPHPYEAGLPEWMPPYCSD